MYIISYKAFSVASFRGKVAVKYSILSLQATGLKKGFKQNTIQDWVEPTLQIEWSQIKREVRVPKKQPNFRAKWRILVRRMKQSSGHPGFLDLFKVQLTQSFIPCWWQQFCNTLDIWNLNLWAGAGFQPSTLFYWGILNVPKKICEFHDLESKLWESCVQVTSFLADFEKFPQIENWSYVLFVPSTFGPSRDCPMSFWGGNATRECEVICEKPACVVRLMQGIVLISDLCWLDWEFSVCFLAYVSCLGSPIRKFWIPKKNRMVDSTWQATTTAEHAVIAELVFLISFGCKNICFFCGLSGAMWITPPRSHKSVRQSS